jgi:hypothetical protein
MYVTSSQILLVTFNSDIEFFDFSLCNTSQDQLKSMSSKRRWDQQGPIEDDSSKPKLEDKSATDAAAAAAAIAAKIAAQFAGGALGAGTKDPHDGDYIQDIDINDVRNRYMLTKGSTQQQVRVMSVWAN